MSSFAVPASWSERRLQYELTVVSDDENIEAITIRDRAMTTERRTMHARILSALSEKRQAIEDRLIQVSSAQLAG